MYFLLYRRVRIRAEDMLVIDLDFIDLQRGNSIIIMLRTEFVLLIDTLPCTCLVNLKWEKKMLSWRNGLEWSNQLLNITGSSSNS